LYISFFVGGGFQLLEIKLITSYISPSKVGCIFVLLGGAQICTTVLLLGGNFLLLRYLPKFQAKKEEKKVRKLLTFLLAIYVILGIIGYGVVELFGEELGGRVWKYKVPGRVISLSYLTGVLFSLTTFIFVAFVAIRKVEFGVILLLIGIILRVVGIYLFKMVLNEEMVFKIYILALITGVIVGGCILFKKFPITAIDFKIVKEIKNYWGYSFLLGLLGPLILYLDRVVSSYFLILPLVAIFTIVNKLRVMVCRFIFIPIEALIPEISYRWEKGREEVIGERLFFLIKLYSISSIFVAVFILVNGKEFLKIVSTTHYVQGYGVLVFLMLSVIFRATFTPIVRTMQAIGRIKLYLISDVIWLCSYLFLLVLFVPKFSLVGIGVAHFLSTTIGMGFSYFYILKHYTTLKIKGEYFFKISLLGLLLWGISKGVQSLGLPLYLGLVGNFSAIIVLGYFLVRWFNLLSPTEINKVKKAIKMRG